MSDMPTKKSRGQIFDSLTTLMDRIAIWLTRPGRVLIPIAIYLAVVMSLGFVFHTYGDGDAETDFYGAYALHAESFLNGRVQIDAYRGPIYPIAVAMMQTVTRLFGTDLYTAAKILSGLSAGLALFLIFRLTLSLFSPLVSLGVLVLTMLNPVFVRYTYTAGNDMFFLPIALLGLHAVLGSERPGWKRLVLCGALCGVGLLTRYNAIGYIVGILASILVINLWDTSWRQRVLAAATVGLVCFAVYLPWGLYCKAEKGQFIYNRNYENLAKGVYVDRQVDVRPFMAKHREDLDGLVSVIAIDPSKFFKKVGEVVIFRWTKMDEVVSWPVLTLAFLGLFFMVVRPRSKRQGAWVVCGLMFFVLLAPIFFKDRFYLFLVPMLLSLAMHAIGELRSVLSEDRRAQRGLALTVLALAVVGAVSTVNYTREYIGGRGFGALCELGKQFAEIRPMDAGKRVIARKPHFGYYAGLVTVPFPRVDTYEDLLEAARKSGAEYLLFTGGVESLRPGLQRLSDINAVNPGFRQAVTSPFGILYQVER